MTRTLEGQLSLFANAGNPTWDDVQKGRAVAVHHGAYSRPCRESCMWADCASGGRCYLFAKPIEGGMCPGSTHLEWL